LDNEQMFDPAIPNRWLKFARTVNPKI